MLLYALNEETYFRNNIIKLYHCFYFSDASSDPLLDEHFRRSLGADYESLFKKKTSTGSGDSESSSPSSSTNSSINESTQSPKVPDQLVVSTNISHQTIQKQLNRSDTKTSPTESANCSSNLQDNNKEDSTQVDDPVKAFQEDLEMEGYTGMSLLSSPIHISFSSSKTQFYES